MEELLHRPRALRVLLALGHQGSLNMRRFVEASGHARQHAQALREDLLRLGLVSVEKLGGHGNAGELSISLTPLGERVTAHLLAIEEALEPDE